MQLRRVRRLSKTRSVRLGKWPKCSRCSGSLGVCERGCGIVRGASVWQPYQVSVSSAIRVQRSFLTCLSVGVFPAERRAKMCWRLRAWRPQACCQAEYSLEADRHCRVVSTRRSSSPAFTPSCLVGSFVAVSVLLALSASTSDVNADQCRTLGFVLEINFCFVQMKWYKQKKSFVTITIRPFPKTLNFIQDFVVNVLIYNFPTSRTSLELIQSALPRFV